MPGIEFFIPGPPVGWARPGQHGKMRYNKAPQESYRSMVAMTARAAMNKAGLELAKGVSVTLSADFRFPFPKTMPESDRLEGMANISTPDLDNLLKLAMDAMTGIVYADDRLISDFSRVRKSYGVRVGLKVTVGWGVE